MPENEKKNSVLSILRGVLKGKKSSSADIVTQAERVITDYINKRKNEIVNKYCKKKTPLRTALAIFLSALGLYFAYIYFSK